MATDRVLCSKPCSLQNQGSSYTDGTFYVYQTIARFMGKAGTGKLELDITDIKGQKRSKTAPLLMLETTKQGKPVLKFNSQEDREAVSAAIAAAGDALNQAAAAAAAGTGSSTAPAAAAAAAGAAPPASGLVQAGPGLPGQQGSSGLQLTAEQRQALLAKHKAVAAQHKALVVDSQTLSEEEFWGSTAVQRAAGLTGAPTTTPSSSRRGLANRIVNLARQAKQSGDGHLADLHMTDDDERQLLAEKPSLRQLYDAQVGSVLSRAEFWIRYFKFVVARQQKRHRAVSKFKQLQQNLTAESAAAVADMNDQQQEGDGDMEALFSALDTGPLNPEDRKALRRRLNPVLDLASAAEDRLTNDGYGLAHNAARSEDQTVLGYSALSSQLAQDYNVHSAVVVGRLPPAAAASKQRQQQSAAAAGSSSAAAAAAAATGHEVMSELSEDELRQYRDQAGVVLEDLQAPPQQQFEELRVTDPRLYFKSISSQQQQQQQQGVTTNRQQQQQGVVDVCCLIKAVDPDHLMDPPIMPGTAKQVLHELCGSGSAAAAAGRGGPGQLPAELQEYMQQQTMVVDELLRHFWQLLPVNSTEKIKKFQRIQKSMDSCYEVLNKVMQQCEPGHKAPVSRLVKPLFEQLDLAGVAARNVERALSSKGQGKVVPAARTAGQQQHRT